MINKILFILFLLFVNTVFSNSLAPSSDSKITELRYVKVGTELGAGYRVHRNAHGCDLSINYAAFFGETWTGGKALYLFYPFSKCFYVGSGLGIVHGSMDVKESMPPLLSNGKGYVEIHKNKIYPTLETSLGYEFTNNTKVKVFTQLELSIPFRSHPFSLYTSGPGESWKPGISVGVGY